MTIRMKFIKNCFLLIAFAASLASCLESKKQLPIHTTGINSLFEQWDTGSTPGVAVAVIKDGEAIYQQGFGLANIEQQIPVTTKSKYHVASLSKQVVAFSILILDQRGLISLDDDISAYLPELPDYGKIITIKDLIYHTSGIRDQWSLLALSGTRIDDVIKQDHVLNLIYSQSCLNFDPGHGHLYSNSGYTLLGEIIRKASGQTLREFTKQHIFDQLEMNDTHFNDDYTELIPNKVVSYYPSDSGGFSNALLNFSTVGASSLITTLEDWIKWQRNFYHKKLGGAELVDRMYETGNLQSGESLSYAYGLKIEEYNGKQLIWHDGWDAGFRLFSGFFPEENLGVVVFSNYSDIDPISNAYAIADLFLINKAEEKPFTQIEIKGKLKGHYHSREGHFFYVVDSPYLATTHTWGSVPKMIQNSDSTFKIHMPGFGTGILKFDVDQQQLTEYISRDRSHKLKKTSPFKYNQDELNDMEGTYYCPELESTYHIVSKDQHLVLHHIKYGNVQLTQVDTDQFLTPHWWMNNILFSRDEEDGIIGFEVNSQRVLNLKFVKKQAK